MTIKTEHVLVCDECRFEFRMGEGVPVRKLRQEAKKQGWQWWDHISDVCPDCVEERYFKLGG